MNNDNEELQPPIPGLNPLNFGAFTRGSSKTIPLPISNPGKKRMLWHADTDAKSWLTLDPSAGSLEPGEQKFVNVTADSSTLEIGGYAATLTFTSEGDDLSAPVHIPVTLDIPPLLPPAVGLSFALPLRSSKTMPLAIINQESQIVQWTVTVDTGGTNWLRLDRYSGTIQPHEVQTLYVMAFSGLKLGDFVATLTFTSEAGDMKSAEVQFPVELHVSFQVDGDNGPHIVVLGQNWLNFGRQKQGMQPMSESNTFPVEAVNPEDNGQVEWTLDTGGVSWLKLVKEPGILQSSLQGTLPRNAQLKVLVTTDISGLPAGNYRTDLILTFAFDLNTDATKAGREPASALIPVTMSVQ